MHDVPIAALEMGRLRSSVGWSPLHRVTSKKRNQYCSVLAFEDGSALVIYFNGDAAWRTKAYGLQRWANWHSCNR